MKKWYLFYSEKLKCPIGESQTKLQRSVGELLIPDNQDITQLQQAGEGLSEAEVKGGMAFPELFAHVPWGQHIEIITHCNTLDEATYYLLHVVNEGWSRVVLQRKLKNNTYSKQGNLTSAGMSTKLCQRHKPEMLITVFQEPGFSWVRAVSPRWGHRPFL